MKFAPILAVLGAVALIVFTLASGSRSGLSQAPFTSLLPMVAADSATYSPTPPTPSSSPSVSPSASVAPSPSATPSPSASPSPSTSPSPSPTGSPTPDIDNCHEELCPRNVGFYETATSWHVTGEIVNNGEGSGARRGNVQVRVLFLDDEGEAVADATVRTEMTVIAGENDEPQFGTRNYSPFHAEVLAPVGTDFETYRVEVISAEANSFIVRNLGVGSPNEVTEAGVFTASGMVDNTSGHDYDSVRVIVALYVNGVVVRVGSAAAVPGTLQDLDSGTFSISIPDAPADTFEAVYWVDALDGD